MEYQILSPSASSAVTRATMCPMRSLSMTVTLLAPSRKRGRDGDCDGRSTTVKSTRHVSFSWGRPLSTALIWNVIGSRYKTESLRKQRWQDQFQKSHRDKVWNTNEFHYCLPNSADSVMDNMKTHWNVFKMYVLKILRHIMAFCIRQT